MGNQQYDQSYSDHLSPSGPLPIDRQANICMVPPMLVISPLVLHQIAGPAVTVRGRHGSTRLSGPGEEAVTRRGCGVETNSSRRFIASLVHLSYA